MQINILILFLNNQSKYLKSIIILDIKVYNSYFSPRLANIPKPNPKSSSPPLSLNSSPHSSTSDDVARRSTSRSTQRLTRMTHGARCSVPSTPRRLTRMTVLCLLSSVHDTVIRLDPVGVSLYWLDSLLLVSDFFSDFTDFT
jgi:hypothetical protein